MSQANLPVFFPTGVRSGGPIIGPSLSLTTPSITAAMIAPAAGVQANKLQQQREYSHRQATGTAIVAMTEDIAVVGGAGTVVGVTVMESTAPTGDHVTTVDVQKSTGGGAFATILTGTISYSVSQANLAVVAGTLLSVPALLAGDVLRVIVTVSGSTSSQGQGLVVTVTTNEAPQ
jgi:hypothetical protein